MGGPFLGWSSYFKGIKVRRRPIASCKWRCRGRTRRRDEASGGTSRRLRRRIPLRANQPGQLDGLAQRERR
jgi:hypothetical protein